MKAKFSLYDASFLAVKFSEAITPACKRVQIAGSIRRKCAEVGDIEIVAEPAEWWLDMLGNATEGHSLDSFDYSPFGQVVKNGHKYKQLVLNEYPLFQFPQFLEFSCFLLLFLTDFHL